MSLRKFERFGYKEKEKKPKRTRRTTSRKKSHSPSSSQTKTKVEIKYRDRTAWYTPEEILNKLLFFRKMLHLTHEQQGTHTSLLRAQVIDDIIQILTKHHDEQSIATSNNELVEGEGD